MRSRATALLPVALAVALAGGCSAGDAATPASSPSGSTASSLGPAPTVTAPPEEGLGPDGLPTASPLTAEQEQFADIHAQENFIDAAVIEAGQAVCDRASYLAQVDDQALGEAISAGDLGLADTAIPLLCPDLLPPLVAARGGFTDGTVTVGPTWTADGTVPVGTYRAAAASMACNWSVLDGNGAVISEGGVASEVGETTLVINENAASVFSDGCRVWLPAED